MKKYLIFHNNIYNNPINISNFYYINNFEY